MEFFGLSLLSFVLVIAAVVGFHEFGHYITARIVGVKVLKFSIGFGPTMASWTSKKTGIEYSLSALPLGGYVKMADERDPEFSKEDADRAFNRAALWKRFLIVFNGPMFNFILAIAIYSALNMGSTLIARPTIGQSEGWAASAGLESGDEIVSVNGENTEDWFGVVMQIANSLGDEITLVVNRSGEKTEIDANLEGIVLQRNDQDLLAKVGILPAQALVPNKVGKVSPESAASRSGLESGDMIVAINGKEVRYFHESMEIIRSLPGQIIDLEILRDGVSLHLQASLDGDKDKPVSAGNRGRLGYHPHSHKVDKNLYRIRKMGPLEATIEGSREAVIVAETTLRSIYKMITGSISPKAISGPVGMAEAIGKSAESGIGPLLAIAAFLSVNLMVLNLLPIPALDGGHLLLFLIEPIVGPITPAVETILTYVGVACIAALMIFAVGLDLLDLIQKLI